MAKDLDPVEIVRRVDLLKAARSSIEALWNDVERYIMPLRLGDMYLRPVAETAIRLIRDDVYDSTGIHSAQRLANSMHGTITNPNVKWRSRQWKDKQLRDDPDSTDWLQQADEIEWGELYDSNFDGEMSSAYQDLVGPGNCFMSVEVEEESRENWRGFNFSCIPIKEAFFERDHRGDMYRFYRWFNWRASEIKSRFPDDKLPEKVEKALAEGGNPDQRFDVIYAIYVRDGVKYGYPLAPENRPVGCMFVLKDSKEQIGKTSGFYEMPVFHCPWETTSGSAWGHGPGMIMSPTVKYINFWMELEDMAVRKYIDPPVLAEERGIISDLVLKPGGVTVVRRLDSIKAFLAEGNNINFSKMSLKELRDQVREGFHNDELQLKDSPQMSATESQIRFELMNRVLGPTMSLIHFKLLVRILDRTFKGLLRNGQFPDVPNLIKQKGALKASLAQPKVVFTGALMRAQMTDEVAAIERWLGQVGAIGKVMPAVYNVVDIMTAAREMALKLGVPAKILRTPQEAAKMAEQQQQVAAEQAKNQIIAARGQAAQEDAAGKKAQQEAA